jgi:hypothetical protein
MLKLVPLIIWSALSSSIAMGFFVPLMMKTMKITLESSDWSDNEKKKNCLLALIG